MKTTLMLSVLLLGIAPAPVAAAVFAIGLNPRNGDKATVDDKVAAINDIRSAGAKGMVIQKTWRDLDPQNGHYTPRQLASDVSFNVNDGREVLLNVQTINTSQNEMPVDIDGKAWNDPATVQRYRLFLDRFAAQTPKPPKYFAIGNEVDVYLEKHPDQAGAYIDFYKQAAAITRREFPDARIGVTVTYAGLQEGRSQLVRRLVKESDVMIVTYYPSVESLAHGNKIPEQLDSLVAEAGGKPIVMQEAGFPSSPLLHSSEEAQAAFFRNLIAEVKARPQFAFVSLFLLHDFPEAYCDTLVGYYGAGRGNSPEDSPKNFKEFLCTLGLKKADGEEKLSWDLVKTHLK